MTCKFLVSTSVQGLCRYCIFPKKIEIANRVEEVKRLKEAKKILMCHLVMIEKRLLTPVNKGGEKYASV